MKILLVNSHHSLLGGTEKYYFELAKLLISKGHEVAFFSTSDKANEPTVWQKYFISKINFRDEGIGNFFSRFSRVFYSFDAKNKIKILLDEFKPDIVHIQNIYYYISPSILPEIKKMNIPIVQTVHDYQLITPSIIFYHNGQICEITKTTSYYKAIFHRCVEGSYAASSIAVIASYLQHIFKYYERCVGYFITPSFFTKKKLIEYGFDKERLIHISNFIFPEEKGIKIKMGSYIFFQGRLLEHKGVRLVIEAAKLIPEINFKIAGSGRQERDLKKLAENYKLKNVEFLGYLGQKQLKKVIAESAFCIVPSVWYENLPYSILEAFALKKTVVASRTGGIIEIVKNHENGILFKSGDVIDMTEKIKSLWGKREKIKKLGEAAYQTVNKKYNQDTHYRELLLIYKKALLKS